jgi:hypothetical protein
VEKWGCFQALPVRPRPRVISLLFFFPPSLSALTA